MDGLADLYQELILDHNARPRNFGQLEGATHSANGVNPLCGDKVTVYADVQDGKICGLSFDGKGCAISRASASLMTDRIIGMTLEQARQLFASFVSLLTVADSVAPEQVTELGKLVAFAGVRDFPMRVKCATLAWHTFNAALKQSSAQISTE